MSTAPAKNPSSPSSESELRNPSHAAVLTLLHKTSSLLPHALPPRTDKTSPLRSDSLEFWKDILSETYDDLASTAERPTRVVGSSRFPLYAKHIWTHSIPTLYQFIVLMNGLELKT